MSEKTINIKGMYSIIGRFGYDRKYHLQFKSNRLKKTSDSMVLKIEFDEYELLEILKTLLLMTDEKKQHFESEMKAIRKAYRSTHPVPFIQYIAE